MTNHMSGNVNSLEEKIEKLENEKNNLNLQIEKYIKDQINYESKLLKLKRELKKKNFLLNGFFDEGIRNITKIIEREVNSALNTLSSMDAIASAISKLTNERYYILSVNVINGLDENLILLQAESDMSLIVMTIKEFMENYDWSPEIFYDCESQKFNVRSFKS